MLTKQKKFILHNIPSFDSFEVWYFRRLPFHQNHSCRFVGDSKFESVISRDRP